MAGPWEDYAANESGPWAEYSQEPKPVPKKIGVEGLPDAVRAVWGDFSPLSQLAVGTKAGLDTGAMWLKQKFTNLTPQDKAEVQANRAFIQDSPMGMLGNLGFNVAATGAPASALYGGAANLATKIPMLPNFLAPTVGAAAAGGVLNTIQPTLDNESTMKNAGVGAAAGAAVDTLMRGAGRVVQPVLQTPAVKNLLEKDVVPTVGQALGGVANRIEEKATSIPLLGDIIAGARNRARNELGTAAINVGMPKGLKVTQPGNAGIEQADDLLSQGYGRLYGNSQVSRDAQLVQDLKNAITAPSIPLSDTYKTTYNQIIKRDVLDRLKPGQNIAASDVKQQVEADLGKAIRALEPKGQDGALREALQQARQAVRDLAGRQAGVDQVQRQALDRGYANMKNMADAARRAESNSGIPTPLQIIQNAKGSELRQLGRDAQEVMGNRVPNSGTADRAMQALLLAGAGGAASAGDVPGFNLASPWSWAALAATPLLYSRGGSRLMMGDLPYIGALQQGSSGAISAMRPYLSPQGGLLFGQQAP